MGGRCVKTAYDEISDEQAGRLLDLMDDMDYDLHRFVRFLSDLGFGLDYYAIRSALELHSNLNQIRDRIIRAKTPGPSPEELAESGERMAYAYRRFKEGEE